LYNVTGIQIFNNATFGQLTDPTNKKGWYKCATPLVPSITNFFNSGSGSNGLPLPGGVETHYSLISAGPGYNLTTLEYQIHGNYGVEVIRRQPYQTWTPDPYTVQTTFTLSGTTTGASLTLNVLVNWGRLTSVTLNGNNFLLTTPYNTPGVITITTGFQLGINTLLFNITSDAGPTTFFRIVKI
jgi:hypothetical protein